MLLFEVRTCLINGEDPKVRMTSSSRIVDRQQFVILSLAYTILSSKKAVNFATK